MCYQISHPCSYCYDEYICDLSNKLCPTINGDVDKNLCDNCRLRLEELIDEEEQQKQDELLFQLKRRVK